MDMELNMGDYNAAELEDTLDFDYSVGEIAWKCSGGN